MSLPDGGAAALPIAGARVLVTGARGFVGARLCGRLRAEGAEVHGVSRVPMTGGDCDRWWRSDVAEPDAAARIVAAVRPGVVFHLGGEVTGARERGAVGATFAQNLASTVHLLDAACEGGVRRVVLAGSLEEPGPEESTPVPSSPYAASKWAASTYARMFHALYGAPVTIARLFMVYGPAQWNERKLIPYVIRTLLRGERPQLASGAREIDWIHVDDAAEGLVALARASGVDGDTLDLGSGRRVSVRTLVETIVALTDASVAPQFGGLAERPLEQVRTADVARTAARLGWAPAIELEEGLRRTVAWYRDGGATGGGAAPRAARARRGTAHA